MLDGIKVSEREKRKEAPLGTTIVKNSGHNTIKGSNNRNRWGKMQEYFKVKETSNTTQKEVTNLGLA